jgi:hypothetical protein
MPGQKVRIALFVAVFLLTALILGHNILIKWTAGAALERALGVDLKMDSFRAGITRSVVKVGDFTVMSPEGFEDEPMMKASHIYADYELGPLLDKEIHLTYLKLNAGEIVVVKNRQGKVNIQEIKKAMERRRRPKSRGEKRGTGKRGKNDGPFFKIDLLVMSLGKIVFKDYSTGKRPRIKTIPFSFSEAQFRDVRSNDIYASMALLASASQFFPQGLSTVSGDVSGLGKSSNKAGKTLKGAGQRLLKQLKKTLRKLETAQD